MDGYYIRTNILILTAILPVILGAYQYRKLDSGTKIFFYFTVFSLLEESVAYYSSLKYHHNMLVYNISTIIEVFIVSLYFNYTIDAFRKRSIGIVVGTVSIIFGIINNFFIQTPNSITNYFLFYQALITIVMSIALLSTFMINSYQGNVKKEVHFWFPVILIFSWSLTYLLFTLIKYYKNDPVGKDAILILFGVGIIVNLAIAMVFGLYSTMNAHVR